MTVTADAVIIGGGVIGCSAAYELSKRGMRVILVEKNFLASGSTARSSAIIRQHYSNKTTAYMALYGLRVFQNFEDIVGGPADFRNTGCAFLVAGKDVPGFRANIAMQKQVGVKTEFISHAELRALEPSIVLSDDVYAAYEAEGGYADPVATTSSFAQAARNLGAEIWQDTRVTRVLMERERIAGVETTRGAIAAANVINCTNAWAAGIAAMVGITLPIHAERHPIVMFQQQPHLEKPRMVIGDFVKEIYYRPEGPALTLTGSVATEHGHIIPDPDNYNTGVEDEYIVELGTLLAERHPVMSNALSKGGYSGMYGVTPDWHPIIDELPAGSSFFVAAGFSGHGFKLSPAVSVMIADMVTRKSEPTDKLDRALFRFARFAENARVHGTYGDGIVG